MKDYKSVTIRVAEATDEARERTIALETMTEEIPAAVSRATDEHSPHLGMTYRESVLLRARADAFEFMAANLCGTLARRAFGGDDIMRGGYAGFLASLAADAYVEALGAGGDGVAALDEANARAQSVAHAFDSHMLQDVAELLEDE